MTQSIESLLTNLRTDADQIQFNDVIDTIDAHYDFSPVVFQNGSLNNESGQNSGSCKVFSFALLHDLSAELTLNLFAQYYRDVKSTPNGDDHQNIRQFMNSGFAGLIFDKPALRVILK